MAMRTNNIPENIDLAVAQSQMTLVETRESSVWRGLCNTKWEAELQGKNSVSIPKPNLNIEGEARNRGGNWTAPTDVTQSNVIFEPTQGFTESKSILWEDADEASWRNLVSKTRSEIAPVLTKSKDREIGAYIKGLTYDGAAGNPSTISFSPGTAYNQVMGLSNNAGNNREAAALVRQAILELATVLFEDDLIDGDTVLGTFSSDFTVVMRARLFKVLMEDMIAQKYQWDQITSDVLNSNTVFGNRAWRGRLHGINIVAHNDIPEEAAGEPVTMYAMSPTAVTMADKTGITQTFTPEMNQISDNPAYLFRQATRYGRLLVEPRFIKKIEIGANKT